MRKLALKFIIAYSILRKKKKIEIRAGNAIEGKILKYDTKE